ncbi:MAG: ThiF family adenylyltransferase [Bacilli bacterium]
MKWDRLEKLIGTNALALLKTKHILIVGLGGVGGMVADALARTALGNISLVDFDTVSLTNINRQVAALKDTINLKKTDVIKKRILDINEDCNVFIYDLFLTEENIDTCFINKIDYIIDANDTIKTKQALLNYARDNKIPIISCMGTGNRLDPSKLVITDLMDTSYDPIARIMRKWVKETNFKQKITVLVSREQPIKGEGRTPSSCSFVPNAAGLLLASYVVRTLINEKRK